MLSRKHKVSSWFFTLRKKPDFSFSGKTFTLSKYNSPTTHPAVAIIVSKKVQKTAVARNMYKRKLFGVFKELLERLSAGTYIVYPRKNIDIQEIQKELKETLQEKFLDKRADVV